MGGTHIQWVLPLAFVAEFKQNPHMRNRNASTRPHRLHSLCPYFAMFPPAFARENILAHTRPGDMVLDPFSGRGTTLLESILLGRSALAIDVNPVAACLSAAKANVPSLEWVVQRISDLAVQYEMFEAGSLEEEARELLPFFSHAFHVDTLRQVLFLRGHLNWRQNSLDCYIAALVLGSLHGEMDRSSSYFSNQMPRTISPKPAYAIRFWENRGLKAKQRNAFDVLRQRAAFRMRDGRPEGKATTILGDARIVSAVLPSHLSEISAVITSPPYLDVTSYEEDQWLRLWFLGGEPRPTYSKISKDDRHTSPRKYWRFLADVWQGVAPLLNDSATIVCRIGGKSLSVEELTSNLLATVRSALPTWTIYSQPVVSKIEGRQTESFRPGSVGCKFEVDIIFRPSA